MNTTEDKKIKQESQASPTQSGGQNTTSESKVSSVGAKKSMTRNRMPQGRRRRSTKREDRRPEFDSKIVSIRRVTRVVAGGRRFSFSVALVAGDRKGRVGVGTGKASDTALAIEKAMRSAKKNMVRIRLTEDKCIPHNTEAKYCSSNIILIPAKGRGIAAGSAVRVVLEFAGIKDVTGKILSRSKNQLNNARATIKALEKLHI